MTSERTVPEISVRVINKESLHELDDTTLKQILELNIKMLVSIKSAALATSRAAYGLHEDGSWDEDQFNKYKTGNAEGDVEYLNPTTGELAKLPSFSKKLVAQGHTIFAAYSDSGKLIALASGDLNNRDAKRWDGRIKAAEDLHGNYFRLLNVSVDEDFRRQGVGTKLLKEAKDYLALQNVRIIEGPVSEQAQVAKVGAFYDSVLKNFDIAAETAVDGKQLVYTVTLPKLIEKEAEENEAKAPRRPSSPLDELLERGTAPSHGHAASHTDGGVGRPGL